MASNAIIRGTRLAAVLVAALSACTGAEERISAERTLSEVRQRFPAAADRLRGERRPELPAPAERAAREAFARSGPLQARHPERADGRLELAFRGVRAQITPVGAAAVPRKAIDSLALYVGAFDRADLLLASDAHRAEYLAYLRDDRAPARLDFEVQVDGGSLTGTGDILDAHGATVLQLEPPWALDADGVRVAAHVQVKGSRLSVWVDPAGLRYPVLLDPAWVALRATLAAGRQDHCSALLGDGRVLVCGGADAAGDPVAGCELFDPRLGSWKFVGADPLNLARIRATATVLKSGKVLLCGGMTNTCALYDAATGWSWAAPMANARTAATATLLRDGRVLMVGGGANMAELYDPASDAWSPAGSIAVRIAIGAAALLPSGKVLAVGGVSRSACGPGCTDVDLFDPATGKWTPAARLPSPLSEHTATLLRDGRVLVAGGGDPDNDAPTNQAWTWSESDPVWRPAANLLEARRRHAAVSLPDGRLLLLGGDSLSQALASTEVFDPTAQTWSSGQLLSQPREGAIAQLLANGDVLLAGGMPSAALASTELYAWEQDWRPTRPMPVGRQRHVAVGLADGRVLLLGGFSRDIYYPPQPTHAYDPFTSTWSAVGTSPERRGMSVTVLENGTILMVGGVDSSGTRRTDETLLLEPNSMVWTTLAPLPPVAGEDPDAGPAPRYEHSASLLPAGKVLIAGGLNGSGVPRRSALVFDVAANQWTVVAPMATARTRHAATSLSFGQVLVTGGVSSTLFTAPALASAERYDPDQDSWTTVTPMSAGRVDHGAVLLGTRVLIAGGVTTAGGGSKLANFLATAELYDPANDVWTPRTSMGAARSAFSMLRLSSGRVFVAGSDFSTANQSDLIPGAQLAEIYDPAADTWALAGQLTQQRKWLGATELYDGRVLIEGGNSGYMGALNTSEIWDPRPPTASNAGPLALAARNATATLLPSGEVLILAPGALPGSYIGQMYHPESGTFTALPDLPRRPHASLTYDWARREYFEDPLRTTLLPSGKVVLWGGTPEVFDPATLSWADLGTPGEERYAHSATLLTNGEVLVAGGTPATGVGTLALASAEIYSPSSDSWRSIAPLNVARARHFSTILANGEALVGGGLPSENMYYPTRALGSLERWDGQTWKRSDPPTLKIRFDGFATSLATGEVLLAGGAPTYPASASQWDSACLIAGFPPQLLDPFAGTTGTTTDIFSLTQPLKSTVVPRPDGSVAVVSGTPCGIVEGFDPLSRVYPDRPMYPSTQRGPRMQPWATMPQVRTGVGAVATLDSRLLLFGGVNGAGAASTSATWLDFVTAPAAARPTLNSWRGVAMPGDRVRLSGARLRGHGEALGGNFACGSSANPVISLVPVADGVHRWIAPVDFSDGSISFVVPADLGLGYWRVTAFSSGVPSNSILLAIRPGVVGEGCSSDATCLSTHCVDGSCCASASCPPCQTCGLAGLEGSCQFLPAGASDDVPAGTCSAPSACDGAGTCRLGLGATCTDGAQCAQGLCVDQRCCESSCTGDCRACDVPGSEGRCTPLPLFAEDAPGCRQADDRACDGAGACKEAVGRPCTDDAACASGVCVDGVCCAPPRDPALSGARCERPCFSCAVPGSVGTCTALAKDEPDGAQCGPNEVCDGAGTCRLALGQTCSAGAQCASGNCADGSCCLEPCAGQCRRCGSDGRCVVLGLGEHDDWPICAAPKACDGQGNCGNGPGSPCAADTDCVTGYCTDGVCCVSRCDALCTSCAGDGSCNAVPREDDDGGACTGDLTCDGKGRCLKRNGQACGHRTDCAYGNCVDGVCCSTAACPLCESCALPGQEGACALLARGVSDSEDGCAQPFACDGAGTCKRVNGASCQDAAECMSGICADGTCCESVCPGTCSTCASARGVCIPVPLGEQDPDPAAPCTGANACDGKRRCALRDGEPCSGGAACASGHCVDGVCCQSSCNGVCERCDAPGAAGSCTALERLAADASCAPLQVCDGNRACKPMLGQACTASAGCASGFCADGTCCASGCTETCMTCANAEGRCEPVPEGQPDLSAASTCAQGRGCDGQGGCLKLDGTPCAAQDECLSGHCVDRVCCESACTETCMTCAPRGNPGTCAFESLGSPDPACGAPEVCDGEGGCGLPLGQICSSDSECATGHCSDGVCCSTACDGDCDQCFDGICRLLGSGHVCRGTNGGCDVEERCLDDSPSCPADLWRASGFVCNRANGVCDVDELCSGSGPECPKDEKMPEGTSCSVGKASGFCQGGVCKPPDRGSEVSPDLFALSSCGCGAAPGEASGTFGFALLLLSLLRARRRRQPNPRPAAS